MKRLYLFILSMSFAILEIAAQNSAKIITLSHNGSDTFFSEDKISDAINSAVDGDTISFSQGTFVNSFILNKAVTLIGTGSEEAEEWGDGTTLVGNIEINIPNSNKKTNILFDGLKFYNQVNLYSTLGNVTFRRCSWSNYFDYNNYCSIETMLLDRCECNFYLGGAGYNPINNKFIAKNCKFTSLNSYENYYFYNCTIIPAQEYIQVDGDNTEDLFCRISGSFFNCIIKNAKAYLQKPDDTSEDIKVKFTNTLYDNYNTNIDVTQKCSLEDCYANTSRETDISKLTKDELEDYKYLGTDGTVVGCYGGENPYSQINSDMQNCSVLKNVHFNGEQEQIEININLK